MTSIPYVKVQADLKGREEPSVFTFFRTWCVPRLVFKPSSGQTALLNVTFKVVDDDMVCEGLNVSLLVVRHRGIHSRTFLEQKRIELDGKHYSNLDLSTIGKNVDHLRH